MASRENIVMYAKDFFGEAIEGEIFFMHNDTVVHNTDFKNGYTVISIPDQLPPGVYEVIARREGGEYRINNFMVSLATHFFNHARKHDDIKLTGDSFKPGEVIQAWKFHPLVYESLNYLTPRVKQAFDNVALHNGNPDGVRWGGQMSLSRTLDIRRGEAVIEGRLVSWDHTSLDIPDQIGVYNIGIDYDDIVISSDSLDHVMGTLRREGPDWLRLEVEIEYHTLQRENEFYYFTDFEDDSSEVKMNMPSSEGVFGVVDKGKVYGTARSSVPTKKVKLKALNTGPVLFTDRLYIYAVDEFFLLWEGPTLLAVLPRWDNHLALDWTDGLIFASWGEGGHTRWSTKRIYGESYVTFSQGDEPATLEDDLQKVIVGFKEIAGNDPADWQVQQSTTGGIAWT